MSSLQIRIEKLVRAVTTRAQRCTEVKRILIAHHLLLGDTLLLAPLLKQLQMRFPEAERVLLLRPMLMPLFAARPYGVTGLPFSRRDPASQRRVIDSGPYDLAIIPDDNRYAWLARAAGARWIMGFAADRPAWKNWMIDQPVAYPTTPAAWADVAAHQFAGGTPPPFTSSEWPLPPLTRSDLPPAGYVVLHVGASSPLKAWSSANWNQLARSLRQQGQKIFFSGAASEASWLEGIEASADERRFFGVLDLADLCHFLAAARALICPDTGVAHLARLVGVPTVAMFGPGSSMIHGAGRFWGEANFLAVTVEDFPCRDQRILFRREIDWVRRCGRAPGNGLGQCPGALCMQALKAESLLAALHSQGLLVGDQTNDQPTSQTAGQAG